MAKKKNTFTEVHGKYEEVASRPNTSSSLDELLGENLSIYTAKSTEEYEKQLSEMNQTDLQAHAYRVGLVPVPDRKLLLGRLISEFQKWNSRYNNSTQTDANKLDNKITDKAMEILREGC
jgi:hypothetical protein